MPGFLIVGGGVAGVTAAQQLRKLEPDSKVRLVSEESYPYYYRPRLWEYLAGSIGREDVFYRPAEWYAAQKIELHLETRIAAVDTGGHAAVTSAGKRIGYDRLLLATGANPYLPPVPGAEKAGVFTLRTLDDASAIREYAAGRRRAVVLGGGLLGLETARALVSAGRKVTVVEVAPFLLPNQMDREGAQVLQAQMEKMGLRILVGTRAEEVLGTESVAELRLAEGGRLPCDLLVFSTGVRARVELAKAAGIAVDRGIVVDDYLQTSAADIFAAGDAAEHQSRLYGWVPPAIEQARAAAENMAGGRKMAYRGSIMSATLKVVGMDLTCLGEANAEGGSFTVLRQSDPEAGVYKRLTIRNGALVGAILLGEKEIQQPVRKLIAARKDVSAWQDRLLDPSFDLAALAR